MGWIDKLKSGLQKTREGLSQKIDKVLVGFGKIDEQLFEDLEEALIMADVGVTCTLSIIEALKDSVKEHRLSEAKQVRTYLNQIISDMLQGAQYYEEQEVQDDDNQTLKEIVMVVGVNGVGKTTTIGKLAARYKADNASVCMIAGDTFRAAAIQQLGIWAQRTETRIYEPDAFTDPAAAVHDGILYAKKYKATIILCDTAGRLHTKTNLMDELKKVHRIVKREAGSARVTVLLVLDASTGQNAIAQAKIFKEMVDVNCVALTKLDGTARGGIVIAIASELKLPIKYIGVGEKIEDLQDFDAQLFAKALFETSDEI
jgi:fused signal recognition particle receptor